MDAALPTGTVTLLFTDIEGSTRLLDALGSEYGAVLDEHRRLLRSTWGAYGGVEVDAEGDAFLVAFQEAGAAVAAAVDAQRRLAAYSWPRGHTLRVRMGVHTGAPQIRGRRYWGSDVHYGARIAAAAHGGQVLVSPTTQLLVLDQPMQSLGEHTVKDFAIPRELFHVVVDGVAADAFPPPRTLARSRSNVPQPATELIGRDDELADLVGRCTGPEKLVTIVGPGGSGKTRLAIELGNAVADRFDQVCFVPLEHVTDPDEVMSSVARALGVPEINGVPDVERVVDHVRSHELLLLLDNVEHLLAAAPAISRVASAGRGLRIVVTSQAPLKVAEEHVLRLGPLRTPSADDRDVTSLAQVPAVELLLRRSRARGSTFELTDANAADVVRLCEQLEGMPLAIELAAARLDVLTPADLVRRLTSGLDALGKGGRDLPPRHRGLRAVLEWTCGLLDDGDRELLGRLSVFAGGFTPDLVESAFGEAVDGLAALMDVGLVRGVEAGRLALRPPVRRFAAELLTATPDEPSAYRAMATALAELAEPFERRWMILCGEGRLAQNPETDNFIAALDWARDRDPLLHARLAAATAWWMNYANLVAFSRGHVELALGRTDDPLLRARCLQALGTLGLADADPTVSIAAADAWRELGDVDGEVISLLYAGNLHSFRHDGGPQALELSERAGRVGEAAFDDEGLQWILRLHRAQALNLLGRHADADTLLRPLLESAPAGSWRLFLAATVTADGALASGRPGDALPLYGVAAQLVARFGSPL
ncbi:MAG: adenylate/guanylate cyclase domain-containing protein, partial [Mycobacteriales bacterium]